MKRTKTPAGEVYELVKANPLFKNIAKTDFEPMMGCLDYRTASYLPGQVIMLTGDKASYVGIILRGSVQVVKEDIEGNATVLSELGACDNFAEVFAAAGISHSPVTVLAASDTEVLRIDLARLLRSCTNACRFHSQMIENMLALVASKTLELNSRIELLAKRTTRDKLLAYFDLFRAENRAFSIPHNKTELARYLAIDRSAMSKELAKMRDEGIINYTRNTFELLG
jgi:CRP-like cAMP-binding protein